ncbi:MAG TPA: carboxypeptidase-like regulatory domain-containing protein [Pyrinomonadaceae bacterium]
MRAKFLFGLFAVAILAAIGGIYVATSSQSQLMQHDVAAGTGAITGQVLDATGQPVKGAKVYADRNEAPMGRRPYVVTDEQGVFTINNLVPGTYTVSTSKEEDGYAPTDVPFYAGYVQAPQVIVTERQTTSGVVVPLGPRAAKLTVNIVDAATNTRLRASQNVQLILRRIDNPNQAITTGPDLKRPFSILVPTVPFTVEVSATGYQHWRYRQVKSNNSIDVLELPAGQVQRLDIALRPDKYTGN